MTLEPALYDMPTARTRPSYARWRAASLVLVYAAMVAHVIHWKLAGRTLAPLELNEVMYTLELGIVTAGFVFMAVIVLATLLFGRFFCSWACHILALEDLCAWLLTKVGVRTRPVRSRLLACVPLGAMFYMFVWPQLARLAAGEALPELRVEGQEGVWASFVTADFSRNLPGAGIATATFFVCGFLIVYLLGSRSFCRCACPYGALFALADRVAPGRIVRTGDCDACALCTAACTSGVDVHKELQAFGSVVDPQCLKDLDCLNACPGGAIGYGLARPSLFVRDRRARGPRRRYPFSWPEEVALAVILVGALLAFRGLYGLVPFLLALGLAVVVAFLCVLGWRLVRKEGVRLGALQLELSGRLTSAGRVFLCVSAAAFALTLHSGFVRYHEWRGASLHTTIVHGGLRDAAPPETRVAALVGIAHLSTAARWGFFSPRGTDRALVDLANVAGEPGVAQAALRRGLRRDPQDHDARLVLAEVLFSTGRARDARVEVERVLGIVLDTVRDVPGTDHDIPSRALVLRARIRAGAGEYAGARSDCEAALRIQPGQADVHGLLGEVLARTGATDEAVTHCREAVRLDPGASRLWFNLAVMLSAAGREAEAIDGYERAAQLDPADPEVRNNLGFLLLRAGQAQAAEEHFREALRLHSDFAAAHFNLGRSLALRGVADEARWHMQNAARLDPAYARALKEGRLKERQ